MDYKGQKLSETICVWIITVAAVMAFLYGYLRQDFQVSEPAVCLVCVWCVFGVYLNNDDWCDCLGWVCIFRRLQYATAWLLRPPAACGRCRISPLPSCTCFAPLPRLCCRP